MHIVFKQIRLLTRILYSIWIFKFHLMQHCFINNVVHYLLSNLLHEDSVRTTNNILHNYQASKKRLPSFFATRASFHLSLQHRSNVVYTSKPFEINPGNSKGCEKQSIRFVSA